MEKKYSKIMWVRIFQMKYAHSYNTLNRSVNMKNISVQKPFAYNTAYMTVDNFKKVWNFPMLIKIIHYILLWITEL